MMTDDVRQQTENHRIAQINQRDDHKPAMRQAVVTWAQVDVPAIESRSRQVFNTTRSFMVVENGVFSSNTHFIGVWMAVWIAACALLLGTLTASPVYDNENVITALLSGVNALEIGLASANTRNEILQAALDALSDQVARHDY
jgi:hypothetical protein